MAKLREVESTKRTARPDNPFGTSPVQDETFEILIPEGAETGKIPAGNQYIGKLIALTKEVSKKREDGTGGNAMWVWVFTITDGPFAGMDFTLWTTLTPNSLWKLGDTLTALGVPWTPGSPILFSRKEMLGTLVRLDIIDSKLGSRDVSKLNAVLPHPDGSGVKAKTKGFAIPTKAEEPEVDEDDDQDEDDEPEVRPRAKKRRAPEPDEPEEDEDDEDEDDEKGKDEWPLPPLTPAKKKKRPVDEDEDEDEDEDDDDEEEYPSRVRRRQGPPVKEEPARRGRPKKKSRL